MAEPHDAPDRADLDVAIVGLAGRFPGARDAEQYWENLAAGRESITHFGEEELLAAGVSPVTLRDRRYVRAQGVLEGADLFDAEFFGVPPREAELMDPQHRHLLEVAWEALEDAGCDPARYPGRIGVYAGSGLNTYLLRNLYPNRRLAAAAGEIQLVLGGDKDFAASRLSFKLNLEGPSVVVQAACSTSLVAVHLACQALLGGECDAALAGGAAVRAPRVGGYLFEEGMIFSPDGHCRAFDARAAGSVPANGAGLVVLKRLADALADGDRVRAVIKGSAVNNDGASKAGYTAPRLEGQARVIRAAHAAAGVGPRSISYVEAHGSGTPVGDSIEVGALDAVFRAGGAAPGSCALGSAKTNIGHADVAAGVAGLIKAVLALEHGQLPPSLNFESPNPATELDQSAFYVNTELRPWPAGAGPRRAGVSSFGLGGTNAHVVLEEAPPAAREPSRRRVHWLPLSARSGSALEAMTDRLAARLGAGEADLADVAHTLGAGRRAFAHRRAVVCETRAGAAAALSSRDRERVYDGEAAGAERPVAFLLSGVGDQYVNMGLGLWREEAAFREAVDRCAAILGPLLGLDVREVLYPASGAPAAAAAGAPAATAGGWDLRSMVGRGGAAPGAAAARLGKTSVLQPAIFVVEFALAQLWAAQGVRPAALLGYSLGEYVAACLAGVWTLEEALTIVAGRARLIDELPPGAMLAVSLPEARARAFATGGAWLAAVNGPSLCVLAGDPDAIASAARRVGEAGETCRAVRTSHALHGAATRAIAGRFAELVASVGAKPPVVPYVSNLTGTWATEAQATSPAYWVEQMCSAVRLAEGLETLCAGGAPLLVELGPGQSLSALALQHPAARGAVVLPSMRHAHQADDDVAVFARAAAKLWVSGADLDGGAPYAGERRRRVPLPTYPFERQRYWVDPPAEVGTSGVSDVPEKDPDVATWFYLPSWRPALAAGPRAEGPGSWLIFGDGLGVGGEVAARVRAEGGRAHVVGAGPADEAGYGAALDAAIGGGGWPDVILHLETLTAPGPAGGGRAYFDACQRRGYHGVLALAKAIEAREAPGRVRLAVVSSALQDVSEDETHEPEKATVLAACKVITQELARVRCEHVDVRPGADAARSAARLVDELRGPPSDAPVALRGSRGRFARAFERVRLERPPAPGPIRPRGAYLITGGLGDVGLTVAQALAKEAGARLVLLGRTGLPPRERWGDWLARHSDADLTGRKIRRLLDVEEAGGDLLLVEADVADASAMRAAFERAEARFGEVHGVFHAAGLVGDVRPIVESGPADAEAHFRAKCAGLYALADVLEGRRPDFVALFSSTASALGGPGVAAYSAASAFMDSFAAARSKAGATRWVSLGWDGWWTDDAASGEAQRTALGRYFMTAPEAIDALWRVLASPAAGAVVVSTGDLDARLRASAGPRERAAGAAAAAAAGEARAEYVAPSGDVEEAVAATWREILGVERVGAHDSFFALGGDSLLGTKVVGRLRRAFQVQISMPQLWKHPTVSRLALLIEELVIDQLLEASPGEGGAGDGEAGEGAVSAEEAGEGAAGEGEAGDRTAGDGAAAEEGASDGRR